MDKQQDAHMHGPAEPSEWVARFLTGVKPGGDVLDVACGSGRHLKLALERGYRATGIDRDISRAVALQDFDGLTLFGMDLEDGKPFPLEGRKFDGVVVSNYLWRPILPAIVGCVAKDGVLIYETYMLGHERLGRPCNPDFLLRPNELIEAVAPRLAVICFEHGSTGGERPKLVQRIAACGPEHAWAGQNPAVLG